MFENDPAKAEQLLAGHCIYLKDSGVEIDGLLFWGSPWQPWFYDWAFNLKTEEELAEKFAMIPLATNVLITHGPAKGVHDKCPDYSSWADSSKDWCHRNYKNAGSTALYDRIRIVQPLLHVCGHIHEGYGSYTIKETKYVNAAICDARYKPVNPPIVINIEGMPYVLTSIKTVR